MIFRRIALLLLLPALFASVRSAHAQHAEPGTFQAGQRVEVEYIPGSGKWSPATIVEVVNDGFSYKVEMVREGGTSTSQTILHFRRVRAASVVAPSPVAAPPRAEPEASRSGKFQVGSYGCTSSAYNSATGSHEYTPRGSLELLATGAYRYQGFKTPSTGRYRFDQAAGKIVFQGGYLNNGEATLMEDRPNRFYLVTPTIPGNRWTCGIK